MFGKPATLDLPARTPRPALVDDVYDAIKTWIMDSVRAGDAKANIDALARSLEVSHTPVREALARLAAEGLVRKEPSRGYLVTPPMGPSEVADLYEFRLLLEPWAAGRAAARCGEADVTALADELARCPVAPGDDSYATYRAIAEHDERFHDLVLRIAGNEEARRAFAGTNCHLHLFRLSYGKRMGAKALSEHQAIAAAISSCDAEGARSAMRTHLEQSQRRIAETIT